ncbi:hypothetical protein RHMOL_Rhmol02G0136900 [Rhododendron molle]|uniref:Uncharacterized protein n=1 Tax=Rhododendron molle TaxID=49168 RepID=A0ACC0PR73_RHOML|nr:hypothetical protein RHMOL_Rhmol02G0136900 [Rhododendron molle]
MVSMADPPSPPRLESLSSCVSVSPMPKPQQLSFEEFSSDRSSCSCVTASTMPGSHQFHCANSLSDRVGEVLRDTASGPQNLRAKRIMAVWRNPVADCGASSAKHLASQKQKKLDKAKARYGCGQAIQLPSQRKRRREGVIEDGPHMYRIPQCRAFC